MVLTSVLLFLLTYLLFFERIIAAELLTPKDIK
jgi:hypothetical protein